MINEHKHICVAHDEGLSLQDMIDKFDLTHIKEVESGEFVPLESFDMSDEELDKIHYVGYLRTFPFGENWNAYLITNFVHKEDKLIILHKIMAKRR